MATPFSPCKTISRASASVLHGMMRGGIVCNTTRESTTFAVCRFSACSQAPSAAYLGKNLKHFSGPKSYVRDGVEFNLLDQE